SGFVQFLPADIQSQFGATDQPFEEDLLFGKLSWQATDRDLLELSLQYRDEVQVDSIGGRRSAEHGRDLINKDERATLRWERSSGGRTAAGWTMIETGPSSGSDATAERQEGGSIASSLTFPAFVGLGEHTLKAGVSYEDLALTFQDAGATNPQVKFEVGQNG